MRALIVGALAALQTVAASPQAVDSARARAAQPPAPQGMDGRLRTEILFIRTLFGSIHAPPPDSFRIGEQEVAAGVTRTGTLAVARGNLAVRGRVTGDAIALHGDVIVYPGGSVAGNAIAVDGRVRTVGGVVEGDVRSIRGVTADLLAHAGGRGAAGAAAPVSTWEAIKMVIGWFAILCVMGIGVLLFAENNLTNTVAALDQQFARAFWIGVLTQVAALPGLMLLVLGLVVSLIGILLIPFAVVAYIIALAGLLTLGFLAVAQFTGRVFFHGRADSRAVRLRSLFLGLAIYLGAWFLAATFLWNPIVGSVLRAVALAGCWVAVTFGLGATILTRAGTRREGDRVRKGRPVDDLSWQTPTPVTGVVAARRPVVTTKER